MSFMIDIACVFMIGIIACVSIVESSASWKSVTILKNHVVNPKSPKRFQSTRQDYQIFFIGLVKKIVNMSLSSALSMSKQSMPIALSTLDNKAQIVISRLGLLVQASQAPSMTMV